MKRTRLFVLILISLLWSKFVYGQQKFDPDEAHYRWPTEASSYLSSTFAETRSAHFHAALDIKTWGRRGYEVYATRDAIVDRIAIGPRGYGKVIYLRHADGSYSVYAHLLSFTPKIQQLADSIRFAEDYKFRMERYLGWKNIRVEQGEIIGFSGASGIGPPHLHFELRTPSHKPFNPLLTNLKVKDNIAPQISAVSVEPLSAKSSIEGKNAIFTKNSRKKGAEYNFGSINVSGPVGLGIDAFDQSNDVYNSYAVYKLSMTADGKEFFKSRVDSFSYKETDQMFIDRVYPILQESNKGYQRLYIADGNSLPFYTVSRNRGVLDLAPGKHSVVIRATDYNGNTSTASLQLNVQKQQTLHPNLTESSVGKPPAHAPGKWNWFSNWVTLSKTKFKQVTIGLADSTKYIRHDNGIAVNLKEADRLYMNIPETGPVIFSRINPDSPTVIPSADLQNFAFMPENTVYDTVSIGMAVDKHSSESISVHILPEVFPLGNKYKFYIRRDSSLTDTSRISFYKLDREDVEWDIIPTIFTGDYIIAETESLGTFALKKDTIPPRLGNPRLKKRPDGKWLVMVDAKDNLSGIDYSRSEISVNGVRGIAEYEPEDDRLVYYHPNFTPHSSMKIKIAAFDKMGNKRSTTFLLNTDRVKK